MEINEQEAMKEVINILETEPATSESDHRESLAIFVASGHCKEMIGVELSLEQIKKLLKDLDKDFMIKRELKTIAGGLYLRYGKYMKVESAALLTANNLKLKEELDKNLDTNLEST